ncbi:hypothetical protein PanWU01x14_279990 [Parasponia andersonii]|uniref:Uncharacterized protein n=1 Tax=Parasponia andersonii TaxID=3476 RepID=A0A2P5B1P5_PARAD|nr:hypothetical protein PanWU01x14_279990 [Parasponia andersonii]
MPVPVPFPTLDQGGFSMIQWRKGHWYWYRYRSGTLAPVFCSLLLGTIEREEYKPNMVVTRNKEQWIDGGDPN